MNKLLSTITENYKPGEPFLLENIENDMKYANLCQQMKKLVDAGSICRYMDGVYYLPKKTVSGIPYSISADTVAELKYIRNRKEEYGCYTGHTLASLLGLSDQVPVTKEIVSNRASAITRNVRVGAFNYIIRKSAVKLTKENVRAVMLLEVLKDIDNLVDIHIDASEPLKKFITSNRIKKSIIDTVLPFYPLRTYKAIYDLELYRVFLHEDKEVFTTRTTGTTKSMPLSSCRTESGVPSR